MSASRISGERLWTCSWEGAACAVRAVLERGRPQNDSARPLWSCSRNDTFQDIRLRRLAEEGPDHSDLRPWRWRWGLGAPGVWVRLRFDRDTRYEAACAGNIC